MDFTCLEAGAMKLELVRPRQEYNAQYYYTRSPESRWDLASSQIFAIRNKGIVHYGESCIWTTVACTTSLVADARIWSSFISYFCAVLGPVGFKELVHYKEFGRKWYIKAGVSVCSLFTVVVEGWRYGWGQSKNAQEFDGLGMCGGRRTMNGWDEE